ncbi:peptidase [Plakobranchus ocellatus]|uniref:Peptidase n=1 Tax=Plakobranchus ocellatus TaxID=259542 RepID=A0AAV4BUP7_9GAST|nr:peptidase [Plakobranchus ocellatus]
MLDTHKFESRYLDGLIAPLDAGGHEICMERSPLHNVDKLQTPLGLFQGDEDKIVLPSQAELMYERVKKKGIPAMFVLFKGEQHGFRKSQNIQMSLDGELYFFGKVLGFQPPGINVDVVHCENPVFSLHLSEVASLSKTEVTNFWKTLKPCPKNARHPILHLDHIFSQKLYKTAKVAFV